MRKLVQVMIAVVAASAWGTMSEAGPIFFPGTLEDGQFVPDREVSQPCYTIQYSTVTATVDNGFAATKIQETIAGPPQRVQTVCLVPLPEGTRDHGVMVAAGVPNKDHALLPRARFLPPAEAQAVYEAVARGLGSAEVLSLTGRPALLIPRFELAGKVEIVVQFRQRVRDVDGVWSLECPVPSVAWAAGPVARLSVVATVTSRDRLPLRTVFSPTHDAAIQRKGLYEAVVRVKTDNFAGNDDFRLCWVADRDDLGLRVLAHRAEGDRDGYFMVVGNPTGGDDQSKAIEKDVIFVLDTSGSMRGEKIEQARAAIDYCIARLNPGDRFNVVTFGTGVSSFRPDPVARSPETLAAAREFVETVVAKGLTNISGALEQALSGRPEVGRPRITIFLTDGTPTAGEQVTEKIIAGVKAIQPCPTRIFVMGVGHDVNAHLLDKLAEVTDGSSQYLDPQEEIDAKVAALYDRLSHPVLTDVAVDFGQLQTSSVYPKELPALFRGSEIMVFGRYREGGEHTLRLTGRLAGRPVSYTCRAELPDGPDGDVNEFVAPLWAARKIGYLLQEIRLHGEDEELIGEVVRLSKKFGIVTEYTEFLAMTDTEVSTEVAVNEARIRMETANSVQAGQWAVNQARNDRGLQSRRVATQDGNNYVDRRGNVVANDFVRQLGRQAFYLRGGQWVDAEEQGDRKTRVVKLFSKEYMELLRNSSQFARSQRLGWAVSVNVGKERIVVEKEGQQKSQQLQIRRASQNRQQLELNQRQLEPNRLQQLDLNQLPRGRQNFRNDFNEMQQVPRQRVQDQRR